MFSLTVIDVVLLVLTIVVIVWIIVRIARGLSRNRRTEEWDERILGRDPDKDK